MFSHPKHTVVTYKTLQTITTKAIFAYLLVFAILFFKSFHIYKRLRHNINYVNNKRGPMNIGIICYFAENNIVMIF